MQPLFFTVGTDLPLMIIPDSQAHVDGHPVLTYTYSVYKNEKTYTNASLVNIEKELHLTKHTNPDYMGYITFEQPGKLFTYTADGKQDLESEEVQEIIEMISHYRDNPQLWQM
jgi:hypothetical protein